MLLPGIDCPFVYSLSKPARYHRLYHKESIIPDSASLELKTWATLPNYNAEIDPCVNIMTAAITGPDDNIAGDEERDYFACMN